MGAKAVDFVHARNKEAWLIEVKDYRGNARTKSIDLPLEIAIKVRDTLADLLSAKCYANDAAELSCAKSLLDANKIHVVCHLEQPAKHSRLRPRAIEPADLVLKLRTLIKAIDPHPKVVDRTSLHPHVHWQVN